MTYDLSKNPEEALESLLEELLTKLGSSKGSLPELRDDGHALYARIRVSHSRCIATARRIANSDDSDYIQKLLNNGISATFESLRTNAEAALDIIIANRFDNHFIDADAEQEFDIVNLDDDDVSELSALLAEARSLVFVNRALSPKHKQNINYWLSKIENELMKEVVGFAAFVAGFTQISSLVRVAGEDAQGIADAVQKMRTKTERKVNGTLSIEAAEQPKQILDQRDTKIN